MTTAPRKIKTTNRHTGATHFWRITGKTLEHHKRGDSWRVVDDNVTDPRTHIMLCGFTITKDSEEE